jgi:hypothetical protein
MKKALIGILAALAATVSVPAHASTTYSFFVACPGSAFVDDWHIGDIDPGREYLRVVVGTKHPDCTIENYNPANDFGIPHNHYTHSGATAVVEGIPFVGQIVGAILGW